MIVALGKAVYEMTDQEFNKLAVAKNKVNILEKKEQEDGKYYEKEWDKVQKEYSDLYSAIIRSREPIIVYEEQLFL